jgi:hypothetical protein
MLRFAFYVWCVFLVQISSALADDLDPYFEQDLRGANADPRYAHLVKASEKVRVYRLHNYAPGDWNTLDPTFDGIISGDAAAKIRASFVKGPPRSRSKKPAVTAVTSRQEAALSSDIAAPVAPSQPSQTSKAQSTSPAASAAPPGQWVAYLRKDFTDIYSITAPNSAPASTGATFSYTDDQIAKNALVSGQGAIFAGYTYLAPQFNLHSQPYLLGFTAGPYYTFDEARNSNSSDFSKNTDTQTYGGTAELASGNFLGIDTFTEFTRVSLGGVQDNIKDTSDISGTANFIPVYAPLLIHWPHAIQTSATTDFLFRFDPSFVVQYDSVEGKNQILLFSNQTKSLRIGPQVGLWSVPFDGVPSLENLIADITYHWAVETYSQQDFHWFEADLTYKINANFGVTASYQNGKNENTGARTNEYLISLSSALDYCVPACAAASSASSQ